MIRLALLLLVATTAVAQENPPIELRVPYVGECFAGCPPLADRGVTCWAYGRFPEPFGGPVTGNGARCASFCQYDNLDGTPGAYWAPRGTGWWGRPSSAPAGVACNATVYLIDNVRWFRPHVGGDSGQADGTDWP